MSTFARLRFSSILLAIGLSLTLVPQISRPALVAAAPAQQTTTLARCGVVIYNTATSPNTLQIGTGPVFQIVPGTTFTIASGTTFATGQNVCVQLTLNASNQITGGTISANTTPAPVTVCGTVTAYTPSVAPTSTSAGTPGSITIATTTATVTYAIAPGATRTGVAPTVGANFCFQLTVNGLNQVTSAAVTSGTTVGGTNAQICGAATGYTPAGAAGTMITGRLVIAGHTLTIAPGVVPAGTALTIPGNDCVAYTLNASGQVASLTVTPNVTAVSFVCGTLVSATAAAGGASVVLSGGLIFAAPAAFAAGLVPGRAYCFLLTNGAISGMLTGVPTVATPAAIAGAGHRIGRQWAD